MKVTYSSLKLKPNQRVKTFDYNGHDIEVLEYLPIEKKYDLVMITLQKADEDGIYNPVKLEMYFNLHLVYMYTNLSFTDKQKENEAQIYDALENNGFFKKFLAVLNDDEYKFLLDKINEIVEDSVKYRSTLSGMIQKLLTELPKKAEMAADVVNSFDKSKFKEIVNLAKIANGESQVGNV